MAGERRNAATAPEPAPTRSAHLATARPRRLGAESEHNHARRQREGFYARYLSGARVLDIGFRGGRPDAEPITEQAIGVELDYPGYDGTHLPFPDESQDAVFASHTLEHIADWCPVLADWFRVLKIGGYLIIAVPHRFLYERKADLPSRFNPDHKRFYTPATLLAEIEAALPLACWRLRSLRDIDDGFSYDTPPETHATGCYEIELVVQRISPPDYAHRLVASPRAAEVLQTASRLIGAAWQAQTLGDAAAVAAAREALRTLPLPGFRLLDRHLPPNTDRAWLRVVMDSWLRQAPFDETDYLARNRDVRAAVQAGKFSCGFEHYLKHGYFAGRLANPVPPIFL